MSVRGRPMLVTARPNNDHPLRAARLAAGLTQDELARRLGISRPLVAAIETSRSPLNDTVRAFVDRMAWAAGLSELSLAGRRQAIAAALARKRRRPWGLTATEKGRGGK